MTLDSLWEELIFEVNSLIKKDLASNEKVLLGSGNRKAPILFIGDDPNLYADDKLIVNPGSSGEFLVKLCDTAEIYPDYYYITTLTKSKLKFKEYFEKDQEKLKEFLDMQIALINPKLIVSLGEKPASLLLEREINFLDEKGKFIKLAGEMELFITFDPSFAKQSRESFGKRAEVAIEFWNDLKQVAEKLQNL